MSQHKASNKRTLRSALKHKVAADTVLDSMDALDVSITSTSIKVAADTNTTWDTDYVSLGSVSIVEMDDPSVGQHKRTMRQVLRSAMSHKKLADEIADTIEEAQVSLNAVLAKMDSGAGTLDAVDGNWDALAIVNLIDADAEGSEAQHKASLRKSIRSAVSHKNLGDRIIDGLSSIEVNINQLIVDIKAKN